MHRLEGTALVCCRVWSRLVLERDDRASTGSASLVSKQFVCRVAPARDKRRVLADAAALHRASERSGRLRSTWPLLCSRRLKVSRDPRSAGLFVFCRRAAGSFRAASNQQVEFESVIKQSSAV